MYDNIYERLELCKYDICDMTIVIRNKNLTLSQEFITSISLEKIYNEDMFPLLRIDCLVSNDLLKIMDDPDTEYIVTLRKGFIKATSNNDKPLVYYKNFIKETFINVNCNNNSPHLEDDINKAIIKVLKTTETSLSTHNNKKSLYLFKKSSIYDVKHKSNKIFNNASILDALIVLLSDCNQRKVLISYPDNKKIYNNIMTPNDLNLKGCIKYIQDVYGIYNTGYMLFVDFDITYLINKDTKCNAYQRNEIKRLYIDFNNINTAKGSIYGQYFDSESQSYIIYSINQPILLNESDNIDKTMFNKITTLNTNTRKQKNYTMENSDTSNNSTILLDNKYDNDYIMNSNIYELDMVHNLLKIQLNEVDLDLLTPNKEFFIKFNTTDITYKKKSGIFKLLKTITDFKKKDKSSYVATTTCILAKK